MDLKAIQVMIGTKVVDGKRQAAYPDFNQLQVVRDSGMDWAYWVDANGGGWHYDKCCAHAVDKPGSPVGTQFGMLLVPIDFAIQAAAAFGGLVTQLTETACEDFFNNHAHAHEPDENVNERVIAGINAKIAAKGKTALTASDNAALDPDDSTPGITKNATKTWAGYKADRGVNLI
jgi:hypothetical protein